jgi:integrase
MAKITGLYWDPVTGKGEIRKQIRGEKLCRRFTASTRDQAEAFYYSFLATAHTPPAEGCCSFRAAATHYLQTETKKSLARDAECLARLDTWIGHLPLNQVHQGTLEGYIQHRRDAGVTSGTVTRELAVARRILTLAARFWRDAEGKPWLPQEPPLFRMPTWSVKKRPHVLNADEQQRLLHALPAHMVPMVLFALHTGARESVVANLRWEWEQKIPELNRIVFVVPGAFTKNATDCLIPISQRLEKVLDSLRGEHPQFVFTYSRPGGSRHPFKRINSSGWRNAWKAAGLPNDTLHGPHNLRHTFARRLRAAQIPYDTIKVLMHHINGDVTLRYAPAELKDLFDAVDALTEPKVVLRAVS